MEAPIISVRLLGPFDLTVNGQANASISSRRARVLFAYLTLRPDYSETRERLADLLWGDRLDKQARQSLRQCLFELRKDLQPIDASLLRVGAEAVALDPAHLDVDARNFSRLAQSPKPEDYCEAARLYRGDFLEFLHLDRESVDDWVGEVRARLRVLAAAALEKSARWYDETENGESAVAEAARLVALDPLGESAQRLYLGVLARHCGREAALAQAGNLTRLWKKEVGKDLENETLDLIDSIRRGDVQHLGAIRAGAHEHAAGTVQSSMVSGSTTPVPKNEARPSVLLSAVRKNRKVRAGLFIVAAIAITVVIGLAAMAGGQLGGFADRFDPLNHPDPGQTAKLASWRSPGILTNVGIDKASLAANGISALLVLPFATIKNDDGTPDDRLAARITEDLISDLSRLPPVRVIARQTSQVYGRHPVDVAAIGAELGVRYVVEGSVQYQPPHLRVIASLVDTSNRLEVWSDQFDSDYDAQFATQDAIVEGVARALHLGVLQAEDRRRPPGQRNPRVEDLLARGWSAMVHLPSLGTSSDAGGYFEQALAQDPGNSSAMIGLGGYHASIVAMFLVSDTEHNLDKAEQLLRAAIKQSPTAVMAYYYLGLVDKMRGRWREAIDDFTNVVKRDPSFPLAYAQIGHLVARNGQPDEAMEYIRYAIRLNPKDPNLGLVSMMAGEVELERKNDDAAMTWLEQVVRLEPQEPFPHAALAAVFALRGADSEAAKEIAEMHRLAPWLTLDLMVQRLDETSTKGHRPQRLIDGLTKAFSLG